LGDALFEGTADEVNSLAWLASSAYAAAGNFASSSACLKSIDLQEDLEDPYRRIAYALLCPSELGRLWRVGTGHRPEMPFLEHLNAYHSSGNIEHYALASHALLEQLAECANPFDVALLRAGRLALRHQELLCAVATLKTQTQLSDDICRNIGIGCPTMLLPAQWEVLRRGLLSNHDNTLITLPTSTGKTLLSQLALISDVSENGGIGIFVAPYIAVARQTVESFNNLCASLPITLSSSTYHDDYDSVDSLKATILVLTPERLEILLNTTLNIDKIRLIVFDEAHIIENGVRGARLEALMIRFRIRQGDGANCRIILMSAALENVAEVLEWLNIAPNNHHDGKWRPTARRIAVWNQTGRLTWLYGADQIRPPSATLLTIRGFRQLSLVSQMYPTELFHQMKLQWNSAYENIAYLVTQLRQEIDGPALVVCMTRRATRGVAIALTHHFPEIDFGPHLQMLESTILNGTAELSGLLRCLRHGVAYHNASLHPNIRAGIEDALKAGEISVVASTTTLAEGADLPFRLTVLYDWLQGFGDYQRPMSPLLFRNIAGRAGRAGNYVEGDTIIFENLLGSLQYTKLSNRQSAVLEVISATPTLRSSFDGASPDETAGINSAFETAFLGSVSDNPIEENLVESFSAGSFSSRAGFQHKLIPTLITTRNKILDASALGGPLGIAASPIRLTKLGIAVRSTNLSPDSARLVMTILPFLNGLSVDAAVARLLTGLGHIPEQGYPKLRSITLKKKRLRSDIKISDFELLSFQWRSGTPLMEAFLQLPSIKKSTRKDFDKWQDGQDVPDWDTQYDLFLDFMESGMHSFVPFIARASNVLNDFVSEANRDDWLMIANEFEKRPDLEVDESNELFSETL